MYLWQYSRLGGDSYKEFTCIYGEIHIKEGIDTRSLHAFMAAFICREGFIEAVATYLWRDS